LYPVLWWGLLAVILFTLEISTASFFFVWLGAGAVVTAFASLFLYPAWIQYSIFGISSLLLVAVSRRWASKISGKSVRLANVDSLVGQTGIITKVMKEEPFQAYAKVDGEAWRVETKDQKLLAVDSKIVVKEVRSNILIVEILNPSI
jgi:membrane protein implicated in regulation of membrane protease activity